MLTIGMASWSSVPVIMSPGRIPIVVYDNDSEYLCDYSASGTIILYYQEHMKERSVLHLGLLKNNVNCTDI